jgi:hypothetical protein
MAAKVYDFTFSQTGLTGLATIIGESYTKAGKIGTTKELLSNAGAVADTYMTVPATETTNARVAFGTQITAPIDLVDTAVTLMGTAGTCKTIELSGKVDDWWYYNITVEKDLTLT